VAQVVCTSCGRSNADDARLCDQCGAVVADARETTSRRTVSILFCDLAGSTAVGERLDPEALRTVLSAYHARMREAVERHGGTVEKFIGDAVMAVFGLPDLHEDDALRAVRAAEEMRSALVELGAELADGRGLRLACRVGVNTGEVVIGRGEALVTGDAVNVAARLEQTADKNQVVLGDMTERLVRGAVETAAAHVIEARGKSEAITAHALIRVIPGADPVARRADAQMVGREDELVVLRALYQRTVRLRTCHLVTVVGPAGIGKSRLAQELIAAVPEALILSGRCLPYGEGITYWPLLEALTGALGDDPVAEIRRLMADSPEDERVARSVAEALGRREGEGGDEIPWAVRRVLETLAETRPVLFVLDDVHWADQGLHSLIDHVAGFVRAAPLLLVCLARPELFDVRPGWATGMHNAASLLLEPLTRAQSRAFVEQLADSGLTEDVCVQIVDAAEGNPLFAEQLLAMTAEDAHAELPLPPTVRALLAARIDRLQPMLRDLLEHAAIEGKVFHLGALCAALPERDPAEIERTLSDLVRRELVRPARSGFPGETAYAFHHLLIRDVAYERLSKQHRAEVHARYAGWLSNRGAIASDIRAYHLERVWELRRELDPSGEPTATAAIAAADALATAGRNAAERGDAGAAANLLARSIAAGAGGDPIGVSVELSYQLIDVGRFAAAAEAIEHLAAMDDDIAGAYADVARLHLAELTETERDLDVDHRRAAEAARLFAERGHDRGVARAWLVIAAYHAIGGRNEESHRARLEALAAARRAGDRAQEIRVAADIPIVLWFGPTPVNAVNEYVDGLLGEADTPIPMQAEALVIRGVTRAAAGDVEAGRADVARGRAMWADLGQQVGWAVTAQIAAKVELLAGDPTRAEALLRDGSTELARLGETSHLSTNEGMRAVILVDLGRLPEAAEAARSCRTSAPRADVSSQTLWRSAESLLRSHSGRHAEAVALARDACALLAHTDAVEDIASGRAVLARVLAAAGEPDAAREELTLAAELFDQKGIAASAREARALLAGLGHTPARARPTA
jgi:class 3 adenylate cyclase/tetratricopeptide (TPR) repeat protein